MILTGLLVAILVILIVIFGIFLGLKRIKARGKLAEQSPMQDFANFGTATMGFVEALGALIVWLIYYIITGMRWAFSGLKENSKDGDKKKEKQQKLPVK